MKKKIFKKRKSIEQVEESNELAPKFDKNGLIPVVTTDFKSGELLMQGYMNNKAFLETIKLGEEISKIVERNFRSTGLFNPLKKESFVQKPDIAHLKPRFEDWALIKAQALITGKVNLQDGKLRVEFRLWDVLAAKEILALAFTIKGRGVP